MTTRPADREHLIDRVIEIAGRTFCAEAGFTLRDKPAPLYQLLTLATLLAKPISSELAVAAGAELRRAGGGTPAGMRRLTWQQRVDALGRGHYRRYDESTATILDEAAAQLQQTYRGDLRRLADAGGHDPASVADLLTELPGIGPTGADIFLREAQLVWPWARPHIDGRVVDGARLLGLPHSLSRLAALFEGRDATALATGPVRVTLDDELVARIRE